MKSKKKKPFRTKKSKLREQRAMRSAPGKLSVCAMMDKTLECASWFDGTWQQRMVQISCSDDDHAVGMNFETSNELREMAAWLTAAAEWIDNQEDNK